MSMEAKRIRKHYIGPAIKLIDTEFVAKRTGLHAGDTYEIETTIWVDEMLPEYRFAIPASKSFDGDFKDMGKEFPIPMKFVTYKPTGRVVYDNTGFSPKPVVYEYILETLLGKRDLVKR